MTEEGAGPDETLDPDDAPDVEPEESGSSGEQIEGNQETVALEKAAEPKGELGQFQWSQATEDLSTIRGHAGMRFLTEGLRSLEAGRANLQRTLAEVREELQRCREEASDSRTEAAVLRERLKGVSGSRRLQQGALTLGGVLLGVAGTQITTGLTLGWSVVAIVGALLMILGWFGSGMREED